MVVMISTSTSSSSVGRKSELLICSQQNAHKFHFDWCKLSVLINYQAFWGIEPFNVLMRARQLFVNLLALKT